MVSADASAVIAPLTAWIRDAPRAIGLTTAQIHAWTSADPAWAAHDRNGTRAHTEEATASAAAPC